MDTVFSAPQILSSRSLQRVTPMMPLCQLVEESRSTSNIPNHLLESKIFAKLKSNSLIQANPPELHFSGFELGKDYIKTLKIINISSEVMDIHIIPTQTKHFKTSYTKKYRLIPGLAYTVKVSFCPDEWRYFYDSVRVHCKGEENLLIPVHAYPVIDDLHIPPHIDLSAVPLGQSVSHAIPLRCSCPIDFEFRLFVIQPSEAFSISPLTGVIPANGEVKITVTFSPVQYQTSQVTIQLIISQFNSKPYLCTITGSSAPHLSPSELGGTPGHGDAVPAATELPLPATQGPRCKIKYRPNKKGEKEKKLNSLACVHPEVKPPVDVCTHAGVAKMLIKDITSSKDLRGAVICGSMDGLQNRKMKETLFRKKVEHNVKELQANQTKWQVRLGDDPVSEDKRRQIAEEKEIVLCMVRSKCMASEGAPSLHSFQQRQRAFTVFQQAARKVVIRCRMNCRLTSLKKLSDGLKSPPSAKKTFDNPVTSSFRNFSVWETTCDQRVSPARVFPFSFPNFCKEDDPLVHMSLDTLPVETTDMNVTTQPFFNLQAPQHHRLMGYHPVSALEAFHSYIPTILDRQLRTGALNEFVPDNNQAEHQQRDEQKEEDVVSWEDYRLSFSAPEALLTPFPANPLRIFNPAPGLQSYKTTPKYLESDLNFHLCPVPSRYTIPESKTCDIRTQTSHAPKTLPDRQEVSRGLGKMNGFPPLSSNCLSYQPGLTRRSSDYSEETLLTDPPAPLTGPPVDLSQLMDQPYKCSRVQLSPKIIRAEFLTWKALVNTNLTRGMTGRHTGELQMEASEFNTIGRRVMTRLKQLEATDSKLAFSIQ
ncbi:cilia- and flagella-associated protein 221 isoform X1 [Labrus bergylta]|uniref:cilia- and flagella-associated protein 221 isoform X1 n=1 Tax=Labrus bergylta TaxID=56723 RepID=UPI003313CD6B